MSPSSRATIKDVAKAAGVSVATVSRTLNNIGVVKEDTRDRVMKAVTELSYAPNVHATSLAKGHSNMIGLVVPDITNPFFNEMAKEIGDAARAKGMDLLLTNTYFDPDTARDCIEDLVEARVAGIVLLTSVFDFRIIEQVAEEKVPVCLLDFNAIRDYVSNININFHNSTIQVIEHLISLGHRNIVYGSIRGPLKLTPERNKTFESCCQRYQSYLDRYRIVEGDYSLEGGRRIIERLLDSKEEPPTAVWFGGDIMAIGALKELRRRQLSVPGQISIIGWGNTQFSAYTDPELTTIAVDHRQIGQLSVAAIDHLLSAFMKTGLEYSVNSTLLVRGSTGPALHGA
ncbi:MAG: LacI family DNA-binding transcriptional regulator [Acidobacteriota bacterium]